MKKTTLNFFLLFTAVAVFVPTFVLAAPVVQELYPADNQTDVSINAQFTMVFDQDVFIGTGNVTLYKAIDDSVVEVFDVTDINVVETYGTAAYIYPTAPLDRETEYYILVDAGALEDGLGDPFAGIADMTAWSFTTQGPLSVTALSPADDATGVSITTGFGITFSEGVFADEGFITLYKAEDDSVVYTWSSWQVSSGEFSLSPEGGGDDDDDGAVSLEFETEYYILIDPGFFVSDESGEPFAGISDPTVWSFTTMALPVRVFDFERISVSSDGEEGDDNSYYFGSSDASVSSDGRYVAFSSPATNLVDSDINGVRDVFVYDRTTDTIERVSVSSAGVEGNDESSNPSISSDGRYVVFQSQASNLVDSNPLSPEDIFLHDRQEGTTEIISVPREDGSFHISQQDELGEYTEVYESTYETEYSTKTFTFEPVDGELTLRIVQKVIPFGGIEAIVADVCGEPLVPTYARYVETGQDVLADILSLDYNVITNHEEPVEISWNIPEGCGEPVQVALTANEYYSSPEGHLMFPVRGEGRATYDFSNTGTPVIDGSITEVDGIVEPDFSPFWDYNTGHPDSNTHFYLMQDDEYLYVLADIVGDNTNDFGLDWFELSVYNTPSGEVESYRVTDLDSTYGVCGFGLTTKASYKHQTCELRVPKTGLPTDILDFTIQYYGTAGAEAGYSVSPVISGNGLYIAFRSVKNLLPEDLNNNDDIYVYDRTEDVFERVSVGLEEEESNNESQGPAISSDGRYVAFLSYATNLVENDTNGVADIFVYDRDAGTTERVNIGNEGEEADAGSGYPEISADGQYVVFTSEATTLVPGYDDYGLFIYDRDLDVIEVIGAYSGPKISADGRYIASTVDGDVYRYDREEDEFLFITEGAFNAYASSVGDISEDGSVIVFVSDATNLVDNDTNELVDTFVWEEIVEEEPPVGDDDDDDEGGGGGSSSRHRSVTPTPTVPATQEELVKSILEQLILVLQQLIQALLAQQQQQ